MAQKLHDIQPGEVSLVHRGANRRRFLLAKSEEFEFEATVAKILNDPADGEDAILEAVRKAGGDEEVLLAASAYARIVEAIPAEVLKAMTPLKAKANADDELESGDDSETEDNDEADDEEMEKAAQEYEAILKRDFTAEDRKKLAANGAAMKNGSYPIENTADLSNAIHAVGRGKAPHAEIRAHIVARAKALGAEDQLPDDWKVNKEETDMTDTATVPVRKEDGTWDLSAVPEDQRPAFEAVLKAQDDELAELRKAAEVEASKADEAIKIAKAEQEKRETREYIEKSAGLKSLAKNDSEFGPVLRDIAKAEEAGHVAEGTTAKLDEVLAAANEQVEKGDLFAEAGRVGASAGTSDALAKIESAATEIRKADTSLTKEQAFAKALDQNKDLYDEYRKEA